MMHSIDGSVVTFLCFWAENRVLDLASSYTFGCMLIFGTQHTIWELLIRIVDKLPGSCLELRFTLTWLATVCSASLPSPHVSTSQLSISRRTLLVSLVQVSSCFKAGFPSTVGCSTVFKLNVN